MSNISWSVLSYDLFRACESTGLSCSDVTTVLGTFWDSLYLGLWNKKAVLFEVGVAIGSFSGRGNTRFADETIGFMRWVRIYDLKIPPEFAYISLHSRLRFSAGFIRGAFVLWGFMLLIILENGYTSMSLGLFCGAPSSWRYEELSFRKPIFFENPAWFSFSNLFCRIPSVKSVFFSVTVADSLLTSNKLAPVYLEVSSTLTILLSVSWSIYSGLFLSLKNSAICKITTANKSLLS